MGRSDALDLIDKKLAERARKWQPHRTDTLF
jgi:hypothetical protein